MRWLSGPAQKALEGKLHVEGVGQGDRSIEHHFDEEVLVRVDRGLERQTIHEDPGTPSRVGRDHAGRVRSGGDRLNRVHQRKLGQGQEKDVLVNNPNVEISTFKEKLTVCLVSGIGLRTVNESERASDNVVHLGRRNARRFQVRVPIGLGLGSSRSSSDQGCALTFRNGEERNSRGNCGRDVHPII